MYLTNFGCKKSIVVVNMLQFIHATCRSLVFDMFEPFISSAHNFAVKSFKASMSETVPDRLVHFTYSKAIGNFESAYVVLMI